MEMQNAFTPGKVSRKTITIGDIYTVGLAYNEQYTGVRSIPT